ILFTAWKGRFGAVTINQVSTLDEAAPGSLEDLFFRTGRPFAFLDLRAGRADESFPFRSKLLARPFGYAPGTGDWTKVADAFVFTEVMAPSTRVGSKPTRAENR